MKENESHQGKKHFKNKLKKKITDIKRNWKLKKINVYFSILIEMKITDEYHRWKISEYKRELTQVKRRSPRASITEETIEDQR